MTDHDPRVDAYITRSAPFAQPILTYLRDVVHAGCPEVEEGLKWRMPFFSYRGSPLCMMAAFKQHCGFGFWLSRQVVGEAAEDGMGQFGKIGTLSDLPSKKALVAYINKAMALNEAGVKMSRSTPATLAPALPDDLATALKQKKHAAARKTYEGFAPGAQREYIDWIVEAKTDITRQKRLASTLEWLAAGKKRHWKYEKC